MTVVINYSVVFLEKVVRKISKLNVLQVVKIIELCYNICYYICLLLPVVILFMWIEVETFVLGLPSFPAQVVLAIIYCSNTLKIITETGLRVSCW